MRPVAAHSAIAHSEGVDVWRRALVALQDEFIEAAASDTGRSVAESYLYDWMPVEASLDYLKENINYFAEPKSLSSGLPGILGRRVLVERRLPLGEVLILGTWNFPLSLHLSQIVFTLAAGNRVTFKSSPYTPALMALFERELPRIFGVDNFKMWKGTDAECVKRVEAGAYQGLIFTGGTSVGKVYARAAAESFTKCVIEASGSEAALLHPTAFGSSKTDAMLDHLLWALMHYNGQTCVAPRFWFVPNTHIETFWESLKTILASKESDATFSSRPPLRHEGVEKEFADWVSWASKLKGAELYKAREAHAATFVRVPSVGDLPVQTPSSFGPGALVVGYDRFADAVEWVKRSPWSLMTQVYGDDFSDRDWAHLQSLETSIVSLNESIVSVGDPAVAFGGKGLSGSGVTHGLEGLREMSRTQVVLEAKSWPLTAEMIQPRWSRISELKNRVPLLKALRKDPVKGIRAFFENRS